MIFEDKGITRDRKLEELDSFITKKHHFRRSIKVILLGSFPRKTHIKKTDLDYFIYYLKEYNHENLREQLDCLFKLSGFKYEIEEKNRGLKYYTVKLKEHNINIDFLPSLVQSRGEKINTQKAHIYVLKELEKQQKSDPLILKKIKKAKIFMKKVGLYNADSKVKGFSGYSIELLILKYNSLKNVPDELVYMEDPTRPFRNVLASVSSSNLKRFHILKKGFKREFRPIKNLYCIKNPSLKLHTFLRKNSFVVNAVYIEGKILVEFKDIVLQHRSASTIDPKVWVEKNRYQSVYTSTNNNIIKVYSFDKILDALQSWQIFKVEETNIPLQRTYCFFK